ncbi:MAG TPA: hypothetical protein VFA79_06355, partial [Myxococcales bacterium]|nr:hypothetical protein [Myxococcales bacterium]
MKAIVFHGIGDIRLDTVKEPKLEDPTDAIVRLTASAICGTSAMRQTPTGRRRAPPFSVARRMRARSTA